VSYPYHLAWDNSANLWISNSGSSATEFTEVSSGTASAFANIDSETGTTEVVSDSSGNIWGGSSSSCSCIMRIAEGATTGSSITLPSKTYGLAVDGSGRVFVGSFEDTDAFYEVANSGTLLTGSNGYKTSFATTFPVVDISGNVWVAGVSNVEQFFGMGTPTVQPLTPSSAGTEP
jgi:hypothetical protein